MVKREKAAQWFEFYRDTWTITNKGSRWWADNKKIPRLYADSLEELREKIKRIESR